MTWQRRGAFVRGAEKNLHVLSVRYTKDQFLNVAVKVCPKLDEDTAIMIGEQVWTQQGDIRNQCE